MIFLYSFRVWNKGEDNTVKLTVTDLEKINTIPSLARLCRTVIEISDCGVRKDYCLDVVESLIPVLKQQCPVLKLVECT